MNSEKSDDGAVEFPADEACKVLLAEALKNGGKDNVTIALARYKFSQ